MNKQNITILTLALSAAALGTSAHAQAAPATTAPGIAEQAQAAINNILKHDKAVIISPRVKECSPPGIIARAIAPHALEVCTVTAEVLISPPKP